jgi:hypothetical protein
VSCSVEATAALVGASVAETLRAPWRFGRLRGASSKPRSAGLVEGPVFDELYEPFLEKFTSALTAVKQGDPRERETECGPLSSQVAADRLEDQGPARGRARRDGRRRRQA